MSDEPIDWPAKFAEISPDALPAQAWQEESPGLWIADNEPLDARVFVGVTPTEELSIAQRVPRAFLEDATRATFVTQLGFMLHDALAIELRNRGWIVGCAGRTSGGDSCPHLWPCPVREAHDYLGQKNGGETHTPIGLSKVDHDG